MFSLIDWLIDEEEAPWKEVQLRGESEKWWEMKQVLYVDDGAIGRISRETQAYFKWIWKGIG